MDVKDLDYIYTNEQLPKGYNTVIEVRTALPGVIRTVSLGTIGDHTSAEFSWVAESNDMEASTVVIPETSRWYLRFKDVHKVIYQIHYLVYDGDILVKLWTGMVESCSYRYDRSGKTVTLNLVSNRKHAQSLVMFPSALASIHTQKKASIGVGRAKTLLKQYLVENLVRQQVYDRNGRTPNPIEGKQLYEYINDYKRARSALEYMSPHYVLPEKPGYDHSPTISTVMQMDSFTEAIEDICKDFNLLFTAVHHIPGRTGDGVPSWVTEECIVYDIVDKDRSRLSLAPNVDNDADISDAARGFLAGIFGTWVLPESSAGTSVGAIDYGTNKEDLERFFGDERRWPWVVFKSDHFHMIEGEVMFFTPGPVTSITGGKSPEALNMTIRIVVNYLIRLALSSIGLSFAGDLISNQLSDLLFAYQRVVDSAARHNLGPYHLSEEMVGSGVTAYSSTASQTLRSARNSAMGYRQSSFVISAEQMRQYRIFQDFDLLDPIGIQDPDGEDIIFTDRLKKITMSEDREHRITFELRLGEADKPEEPWAIQSRNNARYASAITAIANKIG